jgi:hypothetical protein
LLGRKQPQAEQAKALSFMKKSTIVFFGGREDSAASPTMRSLALAGLVGLIGATPSIKHVIVLME